MKNFRITGLDIEHVGPFEKLHVEFPEKRNADKAEIHIFTGQNGSGKTTLLQCLISDIDLHGAQLRMNQLGGKGSIVKTTDSWEGSAGSRWVFDRTNGSFQGDPSSDPGNNLNSGYYYNVNEPFKEDFKNHEFNYVILPYFGYRKVNNQLISSIEEIKSNPLSGAASNSPNHQLIQWIANTKTREALAFKKNDKAALDKYEHAIQKIETVVEEITGWKVEFDLADNPLQVVLKVNEQELNFDVIPDGLNSIISWIADLIMRVDRLKWADNRDLFEKNLVILLDEIDVHLHPAWQRRILPVIQKLFKNAQIFVSTHSPFVINSVDGAWIYKLKKEGGYSKVDGAPVLSEDGKSYRLILNEIFGINEDFGVEAEADLEKFYSFKDRILKGEIPVNHEDFFQLANSLREQSMELNTIIGMELRQINRLKGTPVSA